MTHQAEGNGRKARAILELYRQEKEWITTATRSQHAVRTLDWIFQRPIFSSSDFVETAGIPRSSANRLLTAMKEGDRLLEIRPGIGRRSGILWYPALLNIAEGRDAS